MKNISLYNLINEKTIKKGRHLAIASPTDNAFFSEWGYFGDRLKGKAVILYLKSVISLVRSFVALDGFSSIICPLSYQIFSKDLEHILSLHQFDIVITDIKNSNIDLFKRANIKVCNLGKIRPDEFGQNSKPVEVTQWLIATSGTSSKPKLVKKPGKPPI